jgi:hypothetical protein
MLLFQTHEAQPFHEICYLFVAHYDDIFPGDAEERCRSVQRKSANHYARGAHPKEDAVTKLPLAYARLASSRTSNYLLLVYSLHCGMAENTQYEFFSLVATCVVKSPPYYPQIPL